MTATDALITYVLGFVVGWSTYAVGASYARRSQVEHRVLCPWCMEQVGVNHLSGPSNAEFAAHVQACPAAPENVKGAYRAELYPPVGKEARR